MQKPDYNDINYDYRKYWGGRDYENSSEFIALNKLLPDTGKRVLDIGGGFGRLIPLYKGRFEEIVIVDRSSKILSQACDHARQLETVIKTEEADVYEISRHNLGTFDCVVLVRVVHHLDNLNLAIEEISKMSETDTTFILEYANKFHIKSAIKNLLKLNLGYFNSKPVSRATSDVTFLNFDYRYVKKALNANGFKIVQKLTVSNFRNTALKRRLPKNVLLKLEDKFQNILSFCNFGPSIFVKCVKM